MFTLQNFQTQEVIQNYQLCFGFMEEGLPLVQVRSRRLKSNNNDYVYFNCYIGNSFLYGPDFLVAEDVVLVTINYRLGALGFLSVGIGNAGLKVCRI